MSNQLTRKYEEKLKQEYAKYYRIYHMLKENFILLKQIGDVSMFDLRLIQQRYKYQDYIWWSYPNFQKKEKIYSIAYKLNVKIENGTPKNVVKIVELVNTNTYFNKQIRQFASILTWCYNIFLYYNRYYRYQSNEKLLGKKKFLNYKHGHKLHLISYLKKRELTGIRLNKNHLHF